MRTTLKGLEERVDDYVCILFHSPKLKIPPFILFPKGEFGSIDRRYDYYELTPPPVLSKYSLFGYDCPKNNLKDPIRSFFKSLQSLHERESIQFLHEEPSYSVIGFQKRQLIIAKHTRNPTKVSVKKLMDEWLQIVQVFQNARQEWQKTPKIRGKRKNGIEIAPSLIDNMANGTESEQLSARERLAQFGGEIVRPLIREINRAKYESVTRNLETFIHNAIWVMTQIAGEIKKGDQHKWCSRCLAHCRWDEAIIEMVIPKTFSWEKINRTFNYYGCRICGNSREVFQFQGEMVAVLNNAMDEEQLQTGQSLRINWLKRRSVFDFDRVEIIKTDDEQVERFAVHVGNDNDSWRRPRYKEMRCQVASDCNLSENTLRILKSTFGAVKIGN